MELQLIEKENKTRIKCALKEYKMMKKYIDAQITLNGGYEEKRNSRYVYFIVNADLMNRKNERKS